MAPTHPYATHLDVKFPALAVVDVPGLVKACTDQWYNQTLCQVNESVVRLGVMQGDITGTNMPMRTSSSSSWTVTSSLIWRTGRSTFNPEKVLSYRKESFTVRARRTRRSFL